MKRLLYILLFLPLGITLSLQGQPISHHGAIVAHQDQKVSVGGGYVPPTTNMIAWFSAEEENFTMDESDSVSQWNDISGNDYHIVNSDASDKPVWTSANGVYFDAVNDYLANFSVVESQPFYYYAVLYIDNPGTLVWWGKLAPALAIGGNGASEMMMYGDGFTMNTNFSSDEWFILKWVIDNTNSSIQINETTAATGGMLTTSSTEISIFPTAEAGGYVKEIIIFSTDDTKTYDYLVDKYGL